jgi:hypothetical protein
VRVIIARLVIVQAQLVVKALRRVAVAGEGIAATGTISLKRAYENRHNGTDHVEVVSSECFAMRP